jgi:DNA-binding HxlR family transcriptional regulator
MKDVVSRCPIEQVMQVLSGRWPTLLLYYLKDGTKRFSDLRRDNPAVSHGCWPWNCASSRRSAS